MSGTYSAIPRPNQLKAESLHVRAMREGRERWSEASKAAESVGMSSLILSRASEAIEGRSNNC